MAAAKKKKKKGAQGKRKTKPPLPPRPGGRKRVATGGHRTRKKATGFSSIIRGVADAAVDEAGVGSPIPKSVPRPAGTDLTGSMPEISLRHVPAGRDTLSAIAEETAGRGGVRVTTKSFVKPPSATRRTETSVPEISIAYKPGGRETLAAIDQELAGAGSDDVQVTESEGTDPEPETAVRERSTTLGYDERPLKDPDGRTMIDSAPEVITVEERPIGQTTLAAIAAEAQSADDGELVVGQASLDDETLAAITEEASAEESAEPESTRRRKGALEIHEVVTFVVHGIDIAELKTAEQRQAFVAGNLMHRLPVWSADDIDRVDVSRADNGEFVVVQVLCRLTPGG